MGEESCLSGQGRGCVPCLFLLVPDDLPRAVYLHCSGMFACQLLACQRDV
jgi:hypothetical protein